MRAHISNHDYEQLSAYLDGQLAPGERKKLEERLRARPELKDALEDIGHTRALLRMAPHRKAPRNFTLTPEMVGDAGPGRKTSWLSGLNLFPALGFASTLAAVLLVAVILFDFGPRPLQATQTAYNPAPPQAADARLADQPTQAARTQTEMSNTDNASPSLAAPAAPDATVAAAGGAMAAESALTATPMTTAKLIPGDAVSAAPPVITWDNGGRGGGPGIASGQPGLAGGMGGNDGSSVSSVPGINGVPLVNSYDAGSYSLPLEAVGKLAESPAASEAQRTTPVLPDSAITGTGPILGVPAPEVAGQVIREQGKSVQPERVPDRSAPEAQPAPVLPENAAPAADSTQMDVRERQVLGLPVLRLVEALLLLVAVVAGAGAYFVRRRSPR